MKQKQILAAISAIGVMAFMCLVLWSGMSNIAWMIHYQAYDSMWIAAVMLPLISLIGVSALKKLVTIAKTGSDQ